MEFAATLEEALGHFWAIELNLDERNAKLAVVHATHPIAELYDSIKPVLQEADPILDAEFRTILTDLRHKATADVSREQAQEAVDEAKAMVETVRSAVVRDALSDDPDFRLLLMKSLLETSAVEYKVGVSEGIITNVAEFQDGSAFVWRSQQILGEIRPDVDPDRAEQIDALYSQLWDAYGTQEDPEVVGTLTAGIIDQINEITGVEDENKLLDYVQKIQMLLEDARSEYRQGNGDLALSYATKAYLDNYEFLEGPLIDAGERELMNEIELMMRQDLRGMMRNGAPIEQVDEQIDLILLKMETVEVIVPEFGAIVMAVLAAAVTLTVVMLNTRSRLAIRI